MTTIAAAPAGPSRPGGPDRRITVQVLASADLIDDTDWARVAEHAGLYSSPRWLRALEADPSYDTWYLVARDEGDVVRAIVPAYLDSGTAGSGIGTFYDPAHVFDRPPGMSDEGPALLLGGRTGYGTELLVDPAMAAPDRRTILDAVTTRAGELAQAWSTGTVAALYLDAGPAAELATVWGSVALLTDVGADIELTGRRDFDGYVAALPAGRRSSVRREVREFAASGLSAAWTRLSTCVEDLAPLVASHHRRYGHPDGADQLEAHLRSQAQELDDLSRVLVVRDDGRLVGALLAYEWRDVWYCRLVAVDERLRGRGFATFALIFYEPIRAALAAGASRYALGPSSLTSKVGRGATPVGRWSVLGGRGVPEPGWAGAWNLRAANAWANDLRQTPQETSRLLRRDPRIGKGP